MSVSVSGPWALDFLAIDYFCTIRTLRGPPCGRLYSALRSTLVMCELALGIYFTSPGRKILQPMALTLRTADQGLAQRLLTAASGSHSALPTRAPLGF